MITIRLIIIFIILNVSACDSNFDNDVENIVDESTLLERVKLNNELKEFMAIERNKIMRKFKPEESANEVFDFSKLYCENNGVCKVKLLGSEKYISFSVSNLVRERWDYARLLGLMHETRKNSELVKALKQGGVKSFSDKTAMFNAAMDDSTQISMTINLFEDLQDYYHNKTLQLNK